MKMRNPMVIFLLFCYACVTSGKGNIRFESRNFYNVLKWDPAAPRVPGETVRYSVRYGVTDNEEFQNKPECQNITELSCDLTDETRPDHDTYYRAQVFTNGSLYGTTRTFKPIAETVLEKPTLLLNRTWASLRVNVTLPVGPKNESIEDIFRRNHKGPSEAVIVYRLIITEPPWAEQEIESTSSHFEVSLKSTTEYCGHVVYTPVHEHGRHLSEEETFCVEPQGAPPLFLPWLLLSVAVVVALVLMIICCAKHYSKDVKKVALPSSLVSTLPPSQLILYPENDQHISKAEMFIAKEVTEYAQIRMKPSVLSVADGAYGHKNTIFGEDSSLDTEGVHSLELEFQDDSAQSSDIYGAVTVEDVQLHQLHQTDRKTPSLISGRNCLDENKLLSTPKTIALSSVDIFDNETQPLFLQTLQNSEGQLILPMLSFQGPKMFTETKEELVPPDRKPLLSYLIVPSDKGSNFVSLHSIESSESDSGLEENTLPTPTQDCINSTYLPAQPDWGQDCKNSQYLPAQPDWNEDCINSQYLPAQPDWSQDCINSQYLPAQPDWTLLSPGEQSPQSPPCCDSGTNDSTYRQNWMPSFSHKTSNKNYSWTWLGVKDEIKEEG